MPMSRGRFLTPREVADQLRVSTMTVYRLIKSGELRAVRVGKSYRLRDEDIDAYLSKQYPEAGCPPYLRPFHGSRVRPRHLPLRLRARRRVRRRREVGHPIDRSRRDR